MTTPSPHIPGEHIPLDTSPRAVSLYTALGAARYHGQPHLTPVRASKYELLLRAGFDAVHDGRQWHYRRGDSPLLPLHRAMLCIEVMRELIPGAVEAVA